MTNLRDFLNWFEGFSENLDKAPNAKQWAKIKERLLALKDYAEAAEAAAPPVSTSVAVQAQASPGVPAPPQNESADPVPGGTHTTERWKRQVKAALEEAGFDPESAAEVIAGKGFVVDLNADPKVVAARVVAGV